MSLALLHINLYNDRYSQITAGVTNYYRIYKSPAQRRKAKSFIFHPEYIPNRIAKFDVGLVKVSLLICVCFLNFIFIKLKCV